MASDGILKKAHKGKCRICQRVRQTDKKVKPVGEVHHGYATGHIWECIDTNECDKVAYSKLANLKYSGLHYLIELAIKIGRFKEYIYTV